MEKKTIEYKHGDAVLEGYLAHGGTPKEKRPGLLLCHEWMGLGAYEKERADQLASAGYVVLAADLYGKGIRPNSVETASSEMTKYKSNPPLLRSRVSAALDVLKQTEGVDNSRIAVLGYCFGGCAALELARSGADVQAVVAFHALLDTTSPAKLGQFKAKVLCFHGTDDPMTNFEGIAAFQNEMKNAKVDYILTQFGGVVHKFTNPHAGNDVASGFAYDKTADSRSWIAMIDFFKEIF
jgi:dienelactone hydrolase